MPHARPLLLLLPLALLACTDRPLGETDGSTGTASTGQPPLTTDGDGPPVTTTGGGPGGTLDPTTSSAGSTLDPSTSSTSATVTTGASATTAVDPGDTTIGETDPPAPPDPPGLAGLLGCTLDAPPGTDVGGSTELGPFFAQRAYFGAIQLDGPLHPLLLFVSPQADPAVEVGPSNGTSGPIVYGDVFADPLLDSGWLGAWPAGLTHFADGDQASLPRPDGVTITQLAGSWDVLDPADPPRIVGTLEGAVAGPFDAVYCDQLDEIVIPE